MFNILKHNRPKIGISSIRTYISNIRNIAKNSGMTLNSPSDVCDNKTKLLEYLKQFEPKLRKTKLSSLIVFIDDPDTRESDNTIKHTLDMFRKQLKNDMTHYNSEVEQQKMTQKQRDNWIDWDDVLKQYHELETKIAPHFKKNARTNLTKPEFKLCQLYVLLSCYILIPPRRSTDYTEMKLRNYDTDKSNYFYERHGIGYFVFNIYKTAKKYGREELALPNELKNIIKRWKLINVADYLLINSHKDNKITPTQLTSLLYDFFNKQVSVSMLRHIYLTNKYKNIDLVEMKNDAEAMGHSVQQQMEYVKKS